MSEDSLLSVGSVVIAIIAAYMVLSVITVGRLWRGKQNPAFRSYRVAVVGPPQSGKTTALLSILDLVRRVHDGGVVRLRGETTISRLESGIEKLSRGEFPDPTPEDQSYVYRLDYKLNQAPLSEAAALMLGYPYHYRVEIGDFAGEHAETFFKENKKLSKATMPDSFSIDAKQNFLKWVSESDVCVLFIDLEKWSKLGEPFRNDIINMYMAFWHRYLDLHVDDLKDRAGTPVVLAFSKMDVELKTPRYTGAREIHSEWKKRELALRQEFGRLISFFEKNSRRVDVVSFSAVLRDGAGERLGMEAFLRSILPRRAG